MALAQHYGPHLRRVILLTGTKWYGAHLGPEKFPTYSPPFTEDSPNPPLPCFYYDQVRGDGWGLVTNHFSASSHGWLDTVS
jgi:hypothetical protein